MELNDLSQERRRHKRKNVKVTALLKMGVLLSGRGYTKDISLSGLNLVAPAIFQFTRSGQANDLLGSHVKVMFPSLSLTVNCTLVRIDTAKGEGAMVVNSTSKDEAWEQLCQE
jgi:hypothetical protein